VELRRNESGPVVVHVGAGSEAKRWGMEGWREVVGELRSERHEVVVMAGRWNGSGFVSGSGRCLRKSAGGSWMM
jgi:hypothetical protein